MTLKHPETIKREINRLLSGVGHEISEKFKNINGKTSQGNVPEELFQKRTSRRNRALISWKIVKQNKLDIQQLDTFENGICVEFVNNDYLNKSFSNDDTFIELKNRIGSDQNVSSIISFRVEDGDSGANIARSSYQNFQKEVHPFKLMPIKRKNAKIPGKDNSHWEGNYFALIKGGTHETIDSHENLNDQMLFNPAIEYANEQVCDDLDITLFYFYLHCHDIRNIISNKKDLNSIKRDCETYLKGRNYDEGNLYDYCKKHPCLSFSEGNLVDPIEVDTLNVQDFNTPWSFNDQKCIGICHNEAANKNIFRFDSKNGFVVSAARPTNLFWSKQSSNMIQQSFTLDEFFKLEEERVERRRLILEKIN